MKRSFWFSLMLLVAFAFLGFWLTRIHRNVPTRIVAETAIAQTPSHPSSNATSTIQTNATVLRVVDGDTIVVLLDQEPGEWRVRMLGVNTPESVDPRKTVECFGKEASRHLTELLPTGQRIRLVEDPLADERDKYDRLLRNVMMPDGADVNAALVRDGYAHAYLSFPLTPARKRQLRELQNEAKLAHRGLWSQVTCNGKT